MDTFVTKNAGQTRKLGEMLARELRGGEIICLTGELGSGKTTFAQGVLRGLGAKGPYTSPTFVVMKQYHVTCNVKRITQKEKLQVISYKLQNIYHIDAYRVHAQDILNLGWKEIVVDKKNAIIVEWAEKIKSIIPSSAIWIKFDHFDGNQRKISLSSKFKIQSEKLKLEV